MTMSLTGTPTLGPGQTPGRSATKSSKDLAIRQPAIWFRLAMIRQIKSFANPTQVHWVGKTVKTQAPLPHFIHRPGWISQATSRPKVKRGDGSTIDT